MKKALVLGGAKIPKNCFRCFASHWYDFGGKYVGFMCRALPCDSKIISNCEGRSRRRSDCPLIDVTVSDNDKI